MNNRIVNLGLILLAVLAVIFSFAVYIVEQNQIGLTTVLGNLSKHEGKVIVFEPGLHFKLPLVTKVIKIDTRLRTLTAPEEVIPTVNQEFVRVDYFLKWRVNDFVQFYLRGGDDDVSISDILVQKVATVLRYEFGSKTLKEVISEDRAKVMADLTRELGDRAKELGIEIVDMRIKQIELLPEVQEAVYRSMRIERQQLANEHRFQGQQRAQEIMANADREAQQLVAEAQKNALVMQGEADAAAFKLYAEIYGKDVNFYDFYRSMEAYKQIFATSNKALVLSKQSEFFKYLNRGIEQPKH